MKRPSYVAARYRHTPEPYGPEAGTESSRRVVDRRCLRKVRPEAYGHFVVEEAAIYGEPVVEPVPEIVEPPTGIFRIKIGRIQLKMKMELEPHVEPYELSEDQRWWMRKDGVKVWYFGTPAAVIEHNLVHHDGQLAVREMGWSDRLDHRDRYKVMLNDDGGYDCPGRGGRKVWVGIPKGRYVDLLDQREDVSEAA